MIPPREQLATYADDVDFDNPAWKFDEDVVERIS